jgi:hypothetical protein
MLDNVVIIYRTSGSVDLMGRFDRELVDALPGSVQFVSCNGMKRDVLLTGGHESS